ncbi:MAG: F0F1 ATP synthase subunit B [Anaerolineae bacterium]|nr:F0F1 ATP synthase subunit B [Anaerolineae bacterium]
MQIDWFTVVAEIINFLILVALLKYFLYNRIIGVANQREAKIVNRFKEANQKAEEARQEAESYRSQQEELEARREELLNQAKQETGERRKTLLQQAHEEVEEAKQQWRETLRREQESFLRELRQRTGQQTYALSRRALADLANARLEQQMIEVFIERLKNLDDETRAAIAESLQNSVEAMTIASVFEIPQETRLNLLDILQNQFDGKLEGHFETSSDLICGIELRTNGHKVGWSLEHYLATLERNLARTLEEELQPRSQQKGAETDEV